MSGSADPSERGLPRPFNAVGLPIPYVAASASRLGRLDDRRFGEVVGEQLCQVCGESVGEFAYGIVFRNEPGFDDRIFNGMLHDECLRLSLANCPTLKEWPDAMRLFRFAVGELPIGPSGVPVLPVAMQVDELDPPYKLNGRRGS